MFCSIGHFFICVFQVLAKLFVQFIVFESYYPKIHDKISWLRFDFWAHLCVCTVGSYASHSVCLSVRMSVTGPKFRLDKKSPDKKSYKVDRLYVCDPKDLGTDPLLFNRFSIPMYYVQCLVKIHPTSRWAHFNVKLHFLILICTKKAFWLPSDVQI